MADGVYVLVGPLPVGRHTIRFQAAAPSIGFSLDVTYRITVAPGRAPGA